MEDFIINEMKEMQRESLENNQSFHQWLLVIVFDMTYHLEGSENYKVA